MLDLYEATLRADDLEFAITLAEAMLARFYDAENGGFWQSASGATDLILRVKEDYDGAEPSGNSVAILALLKLGRITDRKAFTQAAEKSLGLFAHRLHQVPQAVPCMLQALDFSLDEPWRAVVAGDPASPKARALLHAIHSVYQPNKVVLGHTGPVEPFAKTLPAKGGPVVYLCSGTACQPPTSDEARVKELLTGKAPARALMGLPWERDGRAARKRHAAWGGMEVSEAMMDTLRTPLPGNETSLTPPSPVIPAARALAQSMRRG